MQLYKCKTNFFINKLKLTNKKNSLIKKINICCFYSNVKENVQIIFVDYWGLNLIFLLQNCLNFLEFKCFSSSFCFLLKGFLLINLILCHEISFFLEICYSIMPVFSYLYYGLLFFFLSTFKRFDQSHYYMNLLCQSICIDFDQNDVFHNLFLMVYKPGQILLCNFYVFMLESES